MVDIERLTHEVLDAVTARYRTKMRASCGRITKRKFSGTYQYIL